MSTLAKHKQTHESEMNKSTKMATEIEHHLALRDVVMRVKVEELRQRGVGLESFSHVRPAVLGGVTAGLQAGFGRREDGVGEDVLHEELLVLRLHLRRDQCKCQSM